ncbi:LacI family DNA-binding transcriptional regulator [Methanocalculus natronophilus]|uniref:LacI family DNA-binding transcriptional regulator n=1 Tax=Methanocalculus natronophilus TaxID=1262400 RepID=UPI0031B589BD
MGKTIYDIAKELNVAPSTVSKALNGKSGISDKTREKILKYAEEVRYYANYNASN